MRVRLLVLAAGVLLPLALWASLPLLSQGRSPGDVSKRLGSKRAELERNKRRDRVLTTDIAAYSGRVRGLQLDITRLQGKQARIQSDVNAKRSELLRIQQDLRRERARLARLRARLAKSRTQLEARLLEMYKAEQPDMITVILESDGFADLLTRSEFLQRVNHHDARIIAAVRRARAVAAATAHRLSGLEARQHKVTRTVLAQRNQVAAIKGQLVDRRGLYAKARDRRRGLLSNIREHRGDIQEDLASLEKENAKIQARLGNGAGAGPIKQGSGNFIWPVNGPVTGQFGENRGDHIHAGLDIAAPEGTPIRAAASGKVALMGPQGGYGNYTCVQHGGSLATCYAHQSRFGTSQGASVSKGEIIGYVGNTGNSSGAHLHFEVRQNGTPVNPLNFL